MRPNLSESSTRHRSRQTIPHTKCRVLCRVASPDTRFKRTCIYIAWFRDTTTQPEKKSVPSVSSVACAMASMATSSINLVAEILRGFYTLPLRFAAWRKMTAFNIFLTAQKTPPVWHGAALRGVAQEESSRRKSSARWGSSASGTT